VTTRRELAARPTGPADTGPWRLTAPEDVRLVERLQRPGAYRARRGASTDPYAVHHLELLGRGAGGCLRVANLPHRGKVVAPRLEFDCEREVLYPAVRGGDVHRWSAVPVTLVLCPNRSPLRADLPSEGAFRKRCPRAFAFLVRHRELLLARASYWAFYGRDTELESLPRSRPGRRYRWATRPGRPGRVVQVSAAPFFAWRDIGAYSFARWKVVWGRMASSLAAAVVGTEPVDEQRLPVLPLDTTAFIPCATRVEAHYLCALLNTERLNRALRSFSAPGRGFAAPSVVGALALERFDPRGAHHAQLARLSLRCHAAARRGDRSALARAEREVERAAAELWGLARIAP
jgi:hypothetical protein